MAQTKSQTKPASSDELSALRERVKELEAQVAEQSGDAKARGSSRRRSHHRDWGDLSNNKAEVVSRAVRGVSLAWIEGIRLFADTVTNVSHDVLDRSHLADDEEIPRGGRQMAQDVVSAFSDAARDWVDIPARAAEQFSASFREGEYRRGRRRASGERRESARGSSHK